ncbi:hypothetical protein EEL32_12145 [Brevibacillus laterosporus]|nr:hypothetical protein [Brevibacillus laterosporus]TPG86857.1 hypothetical protein EEL32_12145 [Brevibacillus laterosporus]
MNMTDLKYSEMLEGLRAEIKILQNQGFELISEWKSDIYSTTALLKNGDCYCLISHFDDSGEFDTVYLSQEDMNIINTLTQGGGE